MGVRPHFSKKMVWVWSELPFMQLYIVLLSDKNRIMFIFETGVLCSSVRKP